MERGNRFHQETLDTGGEVMNEEQQQIIERVTGTGITLTTEQMQQYLATKDDLGEIVKGTEIPVGYKRCGACSCGKKFYLFNKNSGSKTNTSGNCKACQKGTAAKSYLKTKQKRNYKRYYQENKEIKQNHARKYYEENKDLIKVKHQEYLKTKAGQKVMTKAHAKRRKSMIENAGIPYTRQLVIDRDGAFQQLEYPTCYLCSKPIEDISGAGLHLDHVIPVVMGGLNCFTNVASSHIDCNLRREKDARQLQTSQVEAVAILANAYIDANPEKFGE
jgi:hypothetical protein